VGSPRSPTNGRAATRASCLPAQLTSLPSHGGLLRESQRPTQGVTVAYSWSEEAYSGSHRGLLRESRWPTQGVTVAYSESHRCLLMESQRPTHGVTDAYSGSHGGLLWESRRPTQRVTEAYSESQTWSHGGLLRESRMPTQGVTEAYSGSHRSRLRESQWPDSGSHSGPPSGVRTDRLMGLQSNDTACQLIKDHRAAVCTRASSPNPEKKTTAESG